MKKFADKWGDLEKVILSEVSHKEGSRGDAQLSLGKGNRIDIEGALGVSGRENGVGGQVGRRWRERVLEKTYRMKTYRPYRMS